MPAIVAVEHRRFVIMLSGIFFDLVERADFGLLEQQPLPFGLHHRAVGQSRVYLLLANSTISGSSPASGEWNCFCAAEAGSFLCDRLGLNYSRLRAFVRPYVQNRSALCSSSCRGVLFLQSRTRSPFFRSALGELVFAEYFL
jgi:hypothetical protein